MHTKPGLNFKVKRLNLLDKTDLAILLPCRCSGEYTVHINHGENSRVDITFMCPICSTNLTRKGLLPITAADLYNFGATEHLLRIRKDEASLRFKILRAIAKLLGNGG